MYLRTEINNKLCFIDKPFLILAPWTDTLINGDCQLKKNPTKTKY